MQRHREENDMAINEMRKIKTLIKQSQPNIVVEIYTDVECAPVGMIPEGESKLRSSKTQDDIGRPMGEK